MIARRDRLRARLQAAGLDGLIVTSLPSIRYLTGFSGSNAALIVDAVDPSADLLATDGRYDVQVREECPDLEPLIDRATVGALCARRVQQGGGRLAAEPGCSAGELADMRAHLPGVELGSGFVAELRMVKDESEIGRLEVACAITAQAMLDIAEEIGPGWTEIAVARRLEQRFGELGADDRAFATIVAGGEHSAKPHHRPTARPLAVGDLVVVDAGALVDGYHADMTRTFVVGAAEDWQREVHACVAEAAARGRAAALPEAPIADVDAAARSCIDEAGWGDAFVHGLGHGVGLEIHEAPMLTARTVGRLAASMAITIEPGVYLPGRGGVRVEDTIVVGKSVLTEADRSLRSVG